jgi:coniferyl-aldehyde dehydrogenase
MAAAAANLCPVTLELGGKAPAVVAPDFPLATAAERILWAKCMNVMKEEIFGPLLPVKPYREADEVIAYVNAHDRPLAFYPFTNDKRLAERYITEVLSGSVGVNEAIVQVGQHDLPFGGVGASGMGHYHGYEGFLTFSKLRPVFRQARVSLIQAVLQPPYGRLAKFALDWMFRLRG